jgi:benzoyl-CoA reductase/2-hydroxyglutaryl-CoA dehydratase subunit BcrC/BadD/HgdB
VASLVLVLCVLCTAAGDYIAPWTGKHSDELSLKDAVRVMSERSEDWAKEIGLYVAHRHLELGMVAMRALGEANPDQARSASGYIRNLCMTGIDHVKALEAVNGAELTQKHLNAIAEKLK